MKLKQFAITGMFVRIAPFLLLTVLAVGCGSSENLLVTVPVKGSVKLNGKPIQGAVVTFHEAAGKANPCAGTTDKDGKFTLGFGSYQGAMPGKYKVTIEYLTKPDGSPITPEAGMDALQLKMQGLAVQAIPAIYSDPNQTKLAAEVEVGKSEPVDFDLAFKQS